MVADVEEMERAVGAKEQARAVEARPEVDGQAALPAREACVELVRQTREAGFSEARRTMSELGNAARGSAPTPTTCSTDGLPGRNSARSASATVNDRAVGTSR